MKNKCEQDIAPLNQTTSSAPGRERDVGANPADQAEEYERCGLCHRLTDVRRDTPIELRDGYIFGAGQLCPQCFAALHTSNKDK